MSPDVPMWHWIEPSIDAAMSSLPEMYAMFPMIAVQRYLGESGADMRFDDQRQQGTILEIELVSTFADQAAIAIENVRLFDEIQDKSRQLAEASERKSQFLASMSHELRTPLNAIIGLTEMMVTNAARFGTEKALEPLRRVNAAGTHLLSLINEVLDLSKIEAGKLELNPEPVNLARLIDEVIGTARREEPEPPHRRSAREPGRAQRGLHEAQADIAQSAEQCL
jgi:signal transduction histidine kinase